MYDRPFFFSFQMLFLCVMQTFINSLMRKISGTILFHCFWFYISLCSMNNGSCFVLLFFSRHTRNQQKSVTVWNFFSHFIFSVHIRPNARAFDSDFSVDKIHNWIRLNCWSRRVFVSNDSKSKLYLQTNLKQITVKNEQVYFLQLKIL